MRTSSRKELSSSESFSCCYFNVPAPFEAESNSRADRMAVLNNESPFLVFFSLLDPKELDSAPLCFPFLSLVQGC